VYVGVSLGRLRPTCEKNFDKVMETRNPPSHPNPYRCGMCRQPGHDRRNCPCTTVEATRLREEYNRERREESVRRARELNERQQQLSAQAQAQTASNEEWRASMHAQVADMQRRLQALTAEPDSRPPPRTGPTVREVKIQEILFDHCQEIPDGLYKELMDALVLRG
jgi:hypothetical protein